MGEVRSYIAETGISGEERGRQNGQAGNDFLCHHEHRCSLVYLFQGRGWAGHNLAVEDVQRRESWAMVGFRDSHRAVSSGLEGHTGQRKL